MRHILSKQSSRFLTILEFLYYNEYSTFENLAKLSQVSIPTIHEDINKINEFIDPLYIESYSQHECHLVHQDHISVDFIYAQILRNSIEFRLLEKIFFERHERLEEYADSLFISLSTLKRTISRINKQINKNGFKITTNPIRLVGDERLISNMMVNYFREKYLERRYPFNEVQRKVFDQFFYSLIGDETQFLNFPDMEKMRVIIFVSLIRIQNGHHYDPAYLVDLEEKYDFPILENALFKQAFKSVFQIELTKQHIIEMAYPIVSDDFVFNQSELYKIGCKTPARKQEFDQLVNLIDTIAVSLDISLETSQRDRLIYELVNVNLSTVAETYLIYNFKHNFLMNLKSDFPFVYHFLHSHIIDNDFFSQYEEHKIEAIIYVLITHWEELLYTIQFSYPKFKIGVWMDTDVEHINFITNIINKKQYSRFNCEAITCQTYPEALKKFDDYDLIVTNISNLQNNKHRIVSVDIYPSANDFQKLYRVYTELSNTHFNNKLKNNEI